jgi:hypothetical protein
MNDVDDADGADISCFGRNKKKDDAEAEIDSTKSKHQVTFYMRAIFISVLPTSILMFKLG